MAHKHSVYDTDLHFAIDPITRGITNQATGKTKLIQYDHNSERFTFEIPRYIDGHDMSLSDKVEIHYINISSNKTQQSADVYICDDMQISPDSDDVVIFSWLISQNATQYEGTLNFIIRFICLTGELVEYAWSTSVFTGIQIAQSYRNSEAIVEQYTDILVDILEDWRNAILGNEAAYMLPIVTEGDNGKMLVVEEGKWKAGASLAQSTGNSTSAIMSQAATTQAIETAITNSITAALNTEV